MRLLDERRPVVYAIVLGIWLEVFLYCTLHDQYLVTLAPEHFTVYHPPLWGIENERLLALAWAFRASIGPGLVLGLAAAFVGRAGSRPRMPVAAMLKAVALGLLVTELAGLAAGAWSWFTGRTIYPEAIYPELTRPLVTAQSIQLTCYLAGTLVAAGFLRWVWRWRAGCAGDGRREDRRRKT